MVKRVLKNILPEKIANHVSALNHYMYGEPEIRLIRRLCQPGQIALDIGANIGTYTYFLIRYGAEVHAYEPNPELAARLKRLYPNAFIRNVAASDTACQLTLRVPLNNGRQMHELASVADDFESTEVIEYSVTAITIDSEKLTNVGFIKIDVEQHELEVLKGALETIRASRPIIMTEATPLLYEEDLPTTFQFLTDSDYEGWLTFEGRHFPFSEFLSEIHANPDRFGESFMNTNIFLIPSEKSRKDLFN